MDALCGADLRIVVDGARRRTSLRWDRTRPTQGTRAMSSLPSALTPNQWMRYVGLSRREALGIWNGGNRWSVLAVDRTTSRVIREAIH
jgi:hypothetical protein